LEKICDKEKYDDMYLVALQNEISDGIRHDESPVINVKVEPAELEVLPAGESYDYASGRSEITVPKKRRWAAIAEDDESPAGAPDPDDYDEEDDEGSQEGTQALPVHEERDQEAINRQLANLTNIITFAKEICFPNYERTFDVDVANDEGEMVQKTYVLPPWAKAPEDGKCVWCGHLKTYPDHKLLPGPIKCPCCVGIVQIAAGIAIPLADVASSIEAEVEVLEAARKRITECREDFECRRNVAEYPTPGEARGSRDRISTNDIFGFDHFALEGYSSYDDSLRKVLADEITSLVRNSSLVKDAPLPPNLQRER
jgi:hypothetical protein